MDMEDINFWNPLSLRKRWMLKTERLFLLSLSSKLPAQEKVIIERWLQVRLNQQKINLIYQQ